MTAAIKNSGAAFTKNSDTSVASLTLTKPTGANAPAVGDLLVLIVANDDTSNPSEINAPSGWDKANEAGDVISDAHIAVISREADGTEGATIEVTANSTDDMCGWYIVYEGADGITPINVVGSDHEDSGATHTPPAATTTVDDCLAVSVLGSDGGDALPFTVTGTGWALVDEQFSADNGDSIGAGFAHKTVASAGSTGAATFDYDGSLSDGGAGFIFAIAPGAAAAPSGAGTPTLSAIVAAAVAEQPHEGTAAPALASIAVAAAGAMPMEAAGTPTLAPVSLAASGIQAFVGNATPMLEPAAVAASGLEVFLASGAPALEAVLAAAVGNAGAAPSGAGTPQLEAAVLAALGVQEMIGVGSPELAAQAAVAAGSTGAPEGAGTPELAAQIVTAGGLLVPDGAAAPLLAALEASAAGLQAMTAGGSPELAALLLDAAGVHTAQENNAAPVLAALIADALGEQQYFGAGLPELAALEAVGREFLAFFPVHSYGGRRSGTMTGNARYTGILTVGGSVK